MKNTQIIRDVKAIKKRKGPVDPGIMQIGTSLKKVRREKGWTQAQLSRKAKISQQTISSLENGYLNVSLQTLIKIVDVLGLSISIVNPQDHIQGANNIFTIGE